MSLGNWGQNFLKDVAGGFFGSVYLRDYTHASKTFRSNSYANAPKLKFLFHTYFSVNPEAYFFNDTNYGLLVKEVKLPSFSFATHQLNQYNRKRIIQSKIKYDPIEITFHDDNDNAINKLWDAYYQYYYNDGTKPGSVLLGARGGDASAGDPGYSGNGITAYNDRNIYNPDITGDDDWGFSGGATKQDGSKVPFFKNITVFGFNQHNFTAYTLINPIITNFSHDTYAYSEGGGTMQNRMTIDYETVVYNYGALDGRNPGDIVTGFGDVATYDRTLSPISQPGANGNILGQGGLIDGVGGALESLGKGDILGAIRTAGVTYNTFKNVNLESVATAELNAMLHNATQNTPNNRNTMFSFPSGSQTPSNIGTANAPTTGALAAPPNVGDVTYAGTQYNGSNLANPTASGNFPVDAPFGSGFNIGPDNIA